MTIKRNNIALSLLLSVLLVFMAGCERADVGIAEYSTADLVLRLGLDGKPAGFAVSQDAASAAGIYTKASAEVLEGEGLRTLRIIVTQGTPGTSDFNILYNEKITDVGTSASAVLQYGEVTIPDIPVGTVSVYCIGNEESLGPEYANETIMDGLTSGPKLIVIDDETHQFFPQSYTGITAAGLPISGHRTGISVREGMGPVSIDMERAVVKLNLVVENATTSELTLDGIGFGKFSGDRLYMFPERQLDVPDNAVYSTFGFGSEAGSTSLGVSVPAQSDSEPYIVYIYPTYAYTDGYGDNPYWISLFMNSGALKYEQGTFGEGYNSFRRNTQVNIRARITSVTDVKINFEVLDWDDYNVDVPDFE